VSRPSLSFSTSRFRVVLFSSRSSIACWRIAIELELKLGQPLKAKALLYRAVGECPWSKDLYLLPFRQPLRDQFKKSELELWANTMMERQIRLREGIEDYLETEGAENSDNDTMNGEGGDKELESLIDDRRRLAPY